MLANRLRKRFRHLRKWARRAGVMCYRVYERDIPDYPLIIDWYDGEAVVWIYPRTRDETAEEVREFQQEALDEVRAGLELRADQLFIKQRGRQRGLAQYEKLAARGVVRIIEEQGLRFEVNLSDYLDTGLFLDHRMTRALVRERVAGLRVLNLFAYTGSFTCYAIAGGAASTVSVDMSMTYCEWARRNLHHNGLQTSAQHRIVPADCLQYLQDAAARGEQYDFIVLDPPTFSNSKSMRVDSFAIDRDYAELFALVDRVMAERSTLLFSTNSRTFSLDEALLPPRWNARNITRRTLPEDFRNQRIHQCWLMQKDEH